MFHFFKVRAKIQYVLRPQEIFGFLCSFLSQRYTECLETNITQNGQQMWKLSRMKIITHRIACVLLKKVLPSSTSAVKNFNTNPSRNMKLRIEKFYFLNNA